MFLGSVAVMLVVASGLLWWKLVHAREENTQLHAEISRLRARLRALRH